MAKSKLKLFLVDEAGWGVSLSIVAAETAEEAKGMVTRGHAEVRELNMSGPGVVWEYSYSPDTGEGD